VTERRVGSVLLLIMDESMSMRESSSLNVLSRDSDYESFLDELSEGESFG